MAQEVNDALISQAEQIARNLRCEVTTNRCLDFGCRHEGATIMDRDWRCGACAAYEFILRHYPKDVVTTIQELSA